MLDDRKSLGEEGERVAARELRRRGYRILQRNFRARAGEIDIVALDGDVVVFVEVRTRSSDEFGAPGTTITPAKRRRMARTAAAYMHAKRLGSVSCRFDVVEVHWGKGRPRVVVHQDAFPMDARLRFA